MAHDMSSSDDEFFDAPENLGPPQQKSLWDDEEDDLEVTFNALERTCNNEERRNRVETLKHSSLLITTASGQLSRLGDKNTLNCNKVSAKHQSLRSKNATRQALQTSQSITTNSHKSRTCEAWLENCNSHVPIHQITFDSNTSSSRDVKIQPKGLCNTSHNSKSAPESHIHLDGQCPASEAVMEGMKSNSLNEKALSSGTNCAHNLGLISNVDWRSSNAQDSVEVFEDSQCPNDSHRVSNNMASTRQLPWNWALSRLGAAADRARNSAVAGLSGISNSTVVSSLFTPMRESMRPAVARCPPSTPQDATSHLVGELLPSLATSTTNPFVSASPGDGDTWFSRSSYMSSSEMSPVSIASQQSVISTSSHYAANVTHTNRSVTLSVGATLPSNSSPLPGSATTKRTVLLSHESAENTLVRNVNRPNATMDPLEARYRQHTMSNSSLTHSEDSEGGKESVGGHSGILGNLLKRFQKSVQSALPRPKGDDSDEDIQLSHGVRVRSARNMRNKRDFIHIRLVQEIRQEHTGAIWAMRFSPCGRLLATAGQDLMIRVWTLKQYYRFFKAMQNADKPSHLSQAHLSGAQSTCTSASGPSASASFAHNHLYMRDRLAQQDEEMLLDSVSMASTSASTMRTEECSTCSSADEEEDLADSRGGCFRSRPFLILRGHEATVTEVVWSRNLFLLSTSMDKQVRLWHISRGDTLCIFSHSDTVPGICFHPKDDRFFLSGSMDAMLRLWYIPDKRVYSSVEVPPVPSLLTANFSTTFGSAAISSITAANDAVGVGGSGVSLTEQRTIITCVAFTQEGAKIVVGTYDGRVMFFTTDLSYITSISFKPYHGKIRHCKVNGIEPDPTDANKILVTTSDSRARLVDSRDYHTVIKYRGMDIRHTRIRATFSSTGLYIISGSENNQIYVWRKEHDVSSRLSRLSTTRKDRNRFWEAIRSHEDIVTCALFSPSPNLVLDRHLRKRAVSLNEAWRRRDYYGEVIVSADCSGVIKIYKNRLHKQQSTHQR